MSCYGKTTKATLGISVTLQASQAITRRYRFPRVMEKRAKLADSMAARLANPMPTLRRGAPISLTRKTICGVVQPLAQVTNPDIHMAPDERHFTLRRGAVFRLSLRRAALFRFADRK